MLDIILDDSWAYLNESKPLLYETQESNRCLYEHPEQPVRYQTLENKILVERFGNSGWYVDSELSLNRIGDISRLVMSDTLDWLAGTIQQ